MPSEEVVEMTVGIDISPVTTGRTGVGKYCCCLLEHLLGQREDVEYRGFSSGLRRIRLGKWGMDLRRCHIPIPTRALYAMWTALSKPAVDRLLGGLDVFHATNYFLPPTRRARRVLTIYDLTFLVRPDLCSPKVVSAFSRLMGRFAAEADHILACSASTKADILKYLGVEPDRVTVAYGAPGAHFEPKPPKETADRLREMYGIREPFLLFVGALEPRKNVMGIVRAFAQVARKVPHRLILLGPMGWGMTPVFEAIGRLGVEDRTFVLGFVPESHLPFFYSAADVFLFPSHYEGFGLPVIEALACGCPVVTANNSSLPEVVGQAGLFVDADDTGAIADAVLRIVEDGQLQATLRERAKEQAAKFSWDACAKTTFEVYRKVAAPA